MQQKIITIDDPYVIKSSKYFWKSNKANHYTKIYVLSPWKEINVSNNVKYENLPQSIVFHNCIKKIYNKLSYKVINVLKFGLKERVIFILNRIK